MRIIAGEFRGRSILPPKSDTTRPITDRVKQSLFDILTPDLPGAIIYDIFAGTGSLGLESLSRGCAHATFFEADRPALALLKKNIDTLNLQTKSTIIPGDLFKWFANSPAPTHPADVVFLDPPYRFLSERADDLRTLAQNITAHLAPTAQIILRHDVRDSIDLPSLLSFDTRDYGSMRIQFLRLRPQSV